MTKSIRFRSVSEMLAVVRNAPSLDIPMDRCASIATGDYDTEGVSFDEAIRMAAAGWPEGAAKMRSATKLIESGVPAYDDLVPVFDVCGEELDAGRYTAGEPEFMIDWAVDEESRKIVKLVVSCAFSGAISTTTIINRGAAICALVNAVEDRGHRVEVEASLDVLNYYRSVDHDLRVRVVLKQAHDRLDLDRMAFCLAHPAFLRRLCFRLWEQDGRETWMKLGGGGGSYGYPGNPEPEEGAHTFGCLRSDRDDEGVWQTPEDAAAKVSLLIEEMERKEKQGEDGH